MLSPPSVKSQCLLHDRILQRSSHVLSVLGDKAYLFGGELHARVPRDSKTLVVDLAIDAAGEYASFMQTA